jgi:hypothetical protein
MIRCDHDSPGTARRADRAAVLDPLPIELGSRQEIADLPLFARWLAAGGLDFVQLLPINGCRVEGSPYSA